MTENQILYKINCKESKALCLRLEQLIEEADYYEKSLGYHSLEVCVTEIQQIRYHLDTIWTSQVILFYQIQEEFKKKVRCETMVRLNKRDIVVSKYYKNKAKKQEQPTK